MSRSIRRLLGMAVLLVALALLGRALWPEAPVYGVGKGMGPRLLATLSAEQAAMRDLALADSRVQSLIATRRTEVMGVQRVGGQVTAASQGCLATACWMVQLYDMDRNETIQAIVAPARAAVLDVLLVSGMRPGINAELAERARQIAFAAPEVAEALGGIPNRSDWGPMDANFNGRCDEGHYCVAPSFRVGDTIAWAFVDLTTERFIGMAWSSPGPDAAGVERARYSEAALNCAAPVALTQGDWTMRYETTPSDGLRVFQVAYRGQTMLTSAKLVQWHADYGSWGYQDSTGCGGGGGGYLIYPIGEPTVTPLLDSAQQPIGFRLEQTFSMDLWGRQCNYRYGQRYDFYNDGRFRIAAAPYGQGCDVNTLYRPLMRIDVAAGGSPGSDTLSRWDGSGWSPILTESRLDPDTVQPNASNHAWRVLDGQTGDGLAIEPGLGQFGDGGRGDTPFLYVLAHHENEGDTDLGVVGTCCDDDNPGPEGFLNGEPVANEDVVLWYIPQLQAVGTPPDYYCWTVRGNPNPETYPCWSGPMFHPISGPLTAPHAEFDAPAEIPSGTAAPFVNRSSGSVPLSYLWEFGDGATSTEVNPIHSYADAGSYTIHLTVTNDAGSHTATQMIVVMPGPLYLPLVTK